jgi:hypothetical protein
MAIPVPIKKNNPGKTKVVNEEKAIKAIIIPMALPPNMESQACILVKSPGAALASPATKGKKTTSKIKLEEATFGIFSLIENDSKSLLPNPVPDKKNAVNNTPIKDKKAKISTALFTNDSMLTIRKTSI